MRLIKPIVAIAIVLAATFAAVQSLPTSVAADTAPLSDAGKVYPMAYRLTDLPVWSQDGKTFDPMILMAYIKASVDTNAWGTSSTMAPFAENSSVVISTNSANHKAIQDVLKQLREPASKVGFK